MSETDLPLSQFAGLNRRHFFVATASALAAGCAQKETGKHSTYSQNQKNAPVTPAAFSESSPAQNGLPGTNSLFSLSLAGPEFGHQAETFSNVSPGKLNKDYVFSTKKSIQYFVSRGFRLFRIPIRWERIQPVLNGPLTPRFLEPLTRHLSDVREAGASAIIEIHNYGRYIKKEGTTVKTFVINKSSTVRTPHLANLWYQIARQFRDDPVIAGYGLMNEPHSMGSGNWKGISNEVVNAIREIDRDKRIYICGDDWASARKFDYKNGKPWIRNDRNIVYEAHSYFDSNFSGKYRLPYQQELSMDSNLANRYKTVLNPFIDWCKQNGCEGFVGEIGVPNNDPRWLQVLENAVKLLQKNDIPCCYWAAGEWWHDYLLSIQPRKDGKDRPQLTVLNRLMQG
ncbi:MAG: glycoside hydrolase family 5 protein [Planctomycetota bacterium]|nr:glycoside hydrolase family 5 protein [Planctomycetota bacterium]